MRNRLMTSDRHGNFDVFIMPATGGEPRRLTSHSAPESPFTFTPDGQSVLFGAARHDTTEHRGFPAGYMPELYSVPVAGGRATQVLTTPAEAVQYSRDGRLLIYHDKKGQENMWRKHQVSAVARNIWVQDTQSGTHRQITTFAGEDRTPVFTDNDSAFYYLSEESGSFNVHKMPLAGGQSEQMTSFKARPVRFLTAARNGMLSFGYDGALYTMMPGQQPRKVPVTIAADARATNERIVTVTGGATDLAVSPSGKEVAFIARGDVFVTSVEGGVTKQITRTPEAERSPTFSPDGKTYITDARSVGFEPNFRWTRPSIALVNEANYSDGHCFAWAYQAQNIGQLVGMPVPGTCTWGGWATLPDTGIRWGVPALGVKDPQATFLENWQTEPDIRVPPTYAAVSTGKDEQLEAAVSALLKTVGGS